MSGYMDPRHDWLREIADDKNERSELVKCAQGSLEAMVEAEMEWRVAISDISNKIDVTFAHIAAKARGAK